MNIIKRIIGWPLAVIAALAWASASAVTFLGECCMDVAGSILFRMIEWITGNEE